MRFVTMATDSFSPGAIALIQSIIENSGFDKENIEFTVLSVDGFTPKTKDHFHQLPVEIDIVSVESLGEFGFDSELLEEEYKREIQNKFLLFKLPYNENICYIDADQLCLNEITAVSEFKPFTAVMNIGKENSESINNRPMFNTGLFVCNPSSDLFDEIQEFAKRIDQEMMYADQRILNEFFYSRYPESVNLLAQNWNVVTSNKYHQRKLWKHVKSQGVKFLHFTSIKPWFVNHRKPPARFRFHRYKYPLYRKEVKTWESYFQRALQHAE